MDNADDDDPIDDCTAWVGHLPEQNTNSPKRITERSAGGSKQPDIQCEELPVATRGKVPPGLLD